MNFLKQNFAQKNKNKMSFRAHPIYNHNSNKTNSCGIIQLCAYFPKNKLYSFQCVFRALCLNFINFHTHPQFLVMFVQIYWKA